MLWTYRALDRRGLPQEGTIAADDYAKAFFEVDALRMTPVRITAIDERPPLNLETILEAIAIFFEQLGTLQTARLAFWRVVRSMKKRGRQPIDAITAYLPDCHSKRLGSALRSIATDIEVRGRDFAEALADRPHIFPKQHAAMIAVTEGKPTQHDAIESIINEETRARRLASRNFGSRVGVYATYVLAGIAFVIVAKLYLPRFLDASTQLSIQGGPPMTLVAISAVGTFLSSWYSLFIFAAVIVGVRALWERLLRNDEIALFIEKQVWRNYIIKQKKLSDARARALSMIAGMRKAGIDEIKIFEETAKAIDSPHFRQGLLKQAEVCRSGEATFEQSFGDNKHWGGEIISQISGAAPGTYATTMEEIVKDQDERAQGYEAAAAALGTIGHTIAAVLISGLIVSVMYFAQLSILITEARKMY